MSLLCTTVTAISNDSTTYIHPEVMHNLFANFFFNQKGSDMRLS